MLKCDTNFLSSILKWQFNSVEQDDRGINEARGFACEIVAWRFLTYLSEPELIDYLLHEVPLVPFNDSGGFEGIVSRSGNGNGRFSEDNDSAERAALLGGRVGQPASDHRQGTHRSTTGSFIPDNPILAFVGLNALEIASVADAKKFLSQRVVQKVVNDIWNGHIVFWESLSVHTKKKAKIYNKR